MSMGSASILLPFLTETKRAVLSKTPPALWDIQTDPVLAGTKLIAEAWDAAGLYQV
jgi:glycogen operon protein